MKESDLSKHNFLFIDFLGNIRALIASKNRDEKSKPCHSIDSFIIAPFHLHFIYFQKSFLDFLIKLKAHTQHVKHLLVQSSPTAGVHIEGQIHCSAMA